MVMPERCMRNNQSLHRHGILFHYVADARVRVDDDLVGKPLQALAVKGLMISKPLAEAPVPVHQGPADRGVSIEHLLRGYHLDLDRVDIEAKFFESDPL